MGRKNYVSGYATDGLSQGSKNRIIMYCVIGVMLLAIGIVVYIFLPKDGSMDNPYKKSNTEFDMGHNDGSKEPAPTKPEDDENLTAKEKRDKRADSGEFTYEVDNKVTDEMKEYRNGDKLKGYARVEKTIEEHDNSATVSEMTFYSNGEDNFINHLDQVFTTLCIDPGLEPPHDGTNKNTTNRWDGNKVGSGDGKDWWYGLKDYGYTATLETTATTNGTEYDWTVIVNFGYGKYNKDAQRMKCHIKYTVPKADVE